MALTIRLNLEQQRKMEQVQEHLGEKTATKAILAMLERFMALDSGLRDRTMQVQVLKAEKKELENMIRRLLEIDVEKEIAAKQARKLIGGR